MRYRGVQSIYIGLFITRARGREKYCGAEPRAIIARKKERRGEDKSRWAYEKLDRDFSLRAVYSKCMCVCGG